jgi:hypothetical protein
MMRMATIIVTIFFSTASVIRAITAAASTASTASSAALCGNNTFAMPTKNGSGVNYNTQWPQPWCVNVADMPSDVDMFSFFVTTLEIEVATEVVSVVANSNGSLPDHMDFWPTSDIDLPLYQGDGICVNIAMLRQEEIKELWAFMAFEAGHTYGHDMFKMELVIELNSLECMSKSRSHHSLFRV